jgi:hypothetical protein
LPSQRFGAESAAMLIPKVAKKVTTAQHWAGKKNILVGTDNGINNQGESPVSQIASNQPAKYCFSLPLRRWEK